MKEVIKLIKCACGAWAEVEIKKCGVTQYKCLNCIVREEIEK